jgi:hypothetical protein
MYDTGATMSENMSEVGKVTAHDQTELLTSSTKNRLTTQAAGPTPIQSHCRDPHPMRRRLMYDTGATMSENMSEVGKVTAHDHTEILTSATKNRISPRVAGPTPLQSYCRDPLRIRRRLMYDRGATIGENMSEVRKVTPHTRQKHLPQQQKIESLHESPDLRHSKAIAFILIECGVD